MNHKRWPGGVGYRSRTLLPQKCWPTFFGVTRFRVSRKLTTRALLASLTSLNRLRFSDYRTKKLAGKTSFYDVAMQRGFESVGKTSGRCESTTQASLGETRLRESGKVSSAGRLGRWGNLGLTVLHWTDFLNRADR